jgi:hypothetical protein
MENAIREYLAGIGRRGGKKSRRTLDSETARRMVRVRQARRAYRKFYAGCFWSYDPDYVVRASDVPWVVEQLRKHGGREAWETAGKLCR